GILCKEQQVIYQFVHDYRSKFAVRELCRVLSISKSGYYNWIKVGCPKPFAKDAVLVAHIQQIERENDHNYGVHEYYLENEPCVYFARATSCINQSHYVHQWEPPSNLMTPIDDVPS
ncbi:MAG: hypothetical protein KBH76_09470, partial [Prevotella sp.]|nr:hypothetical protein [Prevotella sp.]